MAKLTASFLLGALLYQQTTLAFSSSDHDLRVLGPQGVNLHKLDKYWAVREAEKAMTAQDSQYVLVESGPFPRFQPHWFTQPLDHFANSSETFRQRYWINTRHYKPRLGAPVIVIDGGETSGEDRLPFLDTGIADILANATGGIGVVLEHR